MKLHTEAFKNNIKLLGRELDSTISYILNDKEIILDSEQINSITPVFETTLLKSVMRELDIDSNISIPIGTVINYKFGIRFNDSKYDYIDYGNYVIYSIEKQEDTNSYKIVAYDKMLYSMIEYIDIGIKYPIQVRDYLKEICDFLNIEFASKDVEFANYDKVIQNELYLDSEGNSLGYTFRDVLDELSQVTASNIVINENDELEIRYINETNDVIDKEYLNDANVNIGDKYGPINSIVLSRSAGADNVYLKDEESIEKNGLCEFKISDNQIMNFNDRSDYLSDILSKLNGLEFYTNDIESTGICYYDVCDKYSIQIDDNVYPCIMFNDEILITQGLKENINTPLPEETTTDYSKSDKTDRRINQLYIIANKQEGTIEALSKKVTPLEEQVNNLANSIELFSVDLDSYVLIIPSDSKTPLETKDYIFNHYSYFKGKQVQVVPKSLTNIEGITITTTQEDITISVDSSKTIEELSSELEFQFDYIDGEDNYSVVKKINVSLAPKGIDGKNGENGKDGAPGKDGEPGKDGAPGEPGPAGEQGLPGEKGEKGEKGDKGDPGQQGIQGPKGEDGSSTYFYVKYSENSNGNPMTDTPNDKTQYMGVASTTSATAPTSYSAYTWSRIKGNDGASGTPGQPGADGKTPYLHIKYSEDGQTFTPADEDLGYDIGEKPSAWYGQYVDYTEEDSTQFEDYTWYKFTESIDGTLDKLQEQINDNSASIQNNYSDLIQALSEKADISKIDDITTQVKQLQTDTYTKTEIQQIANGTGVDGTTVTAVISTEGTFDKDGMHYSRSDKDTATTINYKGLEVDDKNGNELLFAGVEDGTENSIVRTDNLTVSTYLRVANNRGRIEEYEDENGNVGVGFFLV